MKIDIGYLLLLAALCPAANGWSLYANGKTIVRKRAADKPVKCAKLSLKKGQNISWYKEFMVSCDFKLYGDSDCDDVVGKAIDNWLDHELTQDVGSYSCLCGPDRFD